MEINFSLNVESVILRNHSLITKIEAVVFQMSRSAELHAFGYNNC